MGTSTIDTKHAELRAALDALGIPMPSAIELLRVITPKEAAALRGVREQTQRRERSRGDGVPYVRLTSTSRGRIGYRLIDVLAWIAEHVHRSTSAETWPVPAVGALPRSDG